jgi:hypothetical protein
MGQGRIAEVFPWVRNRIWRALLKAKNPDTVIRLLQISIYETDPITDPITDQCGDPSLLCLRRL